MHYLVHLNEKVRPIDVKSESGALFSYVSVVNVNGEMEMTECPHRISS